MSNCKTIRDLILTDYVDNQQNASSKLQVNEHLLKCTACQAFAQEVKATLITPLEKAPRFNASDHTWEVIKAEIFKEQQEQYTKETFTEKAMGWIKGLSFPKLVPALAGSVVVCVLVSTVLFNQPMKTAQVTEETSNLTDIFLLTSLDNPADSNEGTAIERYFL